MHGGHGNDDVTVLLDTDCDMSARGKGYQSYVR